MPFCLESIPEKAFTCSHCGYQQPTKEEINFSYKAVLETLVKEKMGAKKWLANLLLLLLLFLGFATELHIMFFPLFLLGFFYLSDLYNRIKHKYEVITVFENALLIEEMINDGLQKKYRELQIKKSQPQSLSSVYLSIFILGVLLLLAVTNPSQQEFQAYYAHEEKIAIELKDLDRTNLMICSKYYVESQKKNYWGILGNFFP